MAKNMVWNCEIQVSGSKSIEGPATATEQQTQATVNGVGWETLWKSSCSGLKVVPCQPDADVEPGNSNT